MEGAIKIAVLGAAGQLGKSLLSQSVAGVELSGFDRAQIDICDKEQLEKLLTGKDYTHVINCAAFTQVDLAENQEDKAEAINHKAVRHLAQLCKKNHIVLVHISTDFVFDGKSNIPYVETDKPKPLGVYGNTKWKGEMSIQSALEKYYIFRTSWLYSVYGHNFVKTILQLAESQTKLEVVDDQIGSPTHAENFAAVILKSIQNQIPFGVYHYSDDAAISWYDFAKEILNQKQILLPIYPIPSAQRPTAAIRPAYSVLNTKKIRDQLQLKSKPWQKSLHSMLIKL